MKTQTLLKLPFLAALLSAPTLLQAQVVLTAASVDYTISAGATGHPETSITHSDALTISSTLGYSVQSGGSEASILGDNIVGPNVSLVSLRSSVRVEAGPLGSVSWATSQASISHTFTVASPSSAVLIYDMSNHGPQFYETSFGAFGGNSIWALSLTTSTGAALLQLMDDGPSLGGAIFSLDLGVLQPGETYTLSAATYAHGQLNGPGLGLSAAGVAAQVSITPVPEPATYALAAGAGLLGFASLQRRRRTYRSLKP